MKDLCFMQRSFIRPFKGLFKLGFNDLKLYTERRWSDLQVVDLYVPVCGVKF